VGAVTVMAPLNVPSLLGQDASELYSKNVYNLLALMLKDNILTIDWKDEVLAKTVLTFAGDLKKDSSKKPAAPTPPPKKAGGKAHQGGAPIPGGSAR